MDIRSRSKLRGRRVTDGLGASVLEAALDCIVIVDADGRILEFNPAAERTFGHTRDAAIGRDAAELLIPPRARPDSRRHLLPGAGSRPRRGAGAAGCRDGRAGE